MFIRFLRWYRERAEQDACDPTESTWTEMRSHRIQIVADSMWNPVLGRVWLGDSRHYVEARDRTDPSS